MGLPAVELGGATQARTILYVEDDALFRITLADHLRNVGYHVVEAGTAEEAVKVLSSGTKIDLVFSDVELPGTMGGFALAVWIRRHHLFIPVVLTSGVGSVTCPLTRQHLVPFLEKPYLQEQAAAFIADVLDPPSDQQS